MESAQLKITKYKNKRTGSRSWRVTGTVDGKRVRKNFLKHADALEEIQSLRIKALNGETHRSAVTTLTDLQIAEAQDAFDRLNGRYSLREAIDYFLGNYKEPTSSFTISDVLDEFLDAKRAAGVRERSIKQLKSTLTQFTKAVPKQLLHEISIADLEDYIKSKSWSPKTQNNFRADLHSFFEWCILKPRQWLSENPASDLPKFKIERGIPQILSFKQSKELMEYVAEKDAGMVPYFALALFAGIRPQYLGGELGKIAQMGADAWDLIDFRNKVIRIPPEISKTGEYRTINIQPNLADWLKPFAKEKASIAVANFERRLKKIRAEKKLGHDVLRHTFISMHVAKFKSVGATALQSGNSEAIVRRHYLKMVAENESKQFWAIKQPSKYVL